MPRRLQLLGTMAFVAADSCSDRTGCAACVTKADATNYECNWCEKDATCHALGSLTSKCTFSNDCISLSSLSTCSHKSTEFCPVSDSTPEQVHISFAGEYHISINTLSTCPTPTNLASIQPHISRGQVTRSPSRGSPRVWPASRPCSTAERGQR